jgi:Rrf2 family protein
MKITAQEEYGLRCLLRIAREDDRHSLTITEVSAAEGLSVPYVGKLLAVLRQAGLIESVRGRLGGYRLALPASDITVGSVMLVLGEPLFDDPGYCQRHAGSESEGNCVHHGGCTLKAIWQTLEHWMRRALDQISIADLLQSEGNIVELLRSRLIAEVADVTPETPPLTEVGLTNLFRTSEPLTAKS